MMISFDIIIKQAQSIHNTPPEGKSKFSKDTLALSDVRRVPKICSTYLGLCTSSLQCFVGVDIPCKFLL